MADIKKDPIRANGEEVDESLIQREFQLLCERYSREMDPAQMAHMQARIESDARENAVERVLLMQRARAEIKAVAPGESKARFIALQQQHGGAEEFRRRFALTPEEEVRIKAELEDGIRMRAHVDAGRGYLAQQGVQLRAVDVGEERDVLGECSGHDLGALRDQADR